MMKSISLKEIVGSPDNRGWTQIHQFSGLEKEKKEKRGQMVLLLLLKKASEEAATGYGREIISRIYEEYYGNLEGLPMERLKETLNKVGKEQPVYLTEEISLSLLVAVFWKGFLYLGIWGEGKILLLREGEMSFLLEGEGKQALLISGLAQREDLFVMGTGAFFSQLPSGTIKAFLQSKDVQTAAEGLSSLVYARPDQSQVGAALIKVEGKEEEERKETTLRSESKLLQGSPKLRVEKKDKISFSKLSFFQSRQNLILGVVLLILLVALTGVGIYRHQKTSRQQIFAKLAQEAAQKLETAESISQQGNDQSLNLLKEAESLILAAEKVKGDHSSLTDLKKRAEDLSIFLGSGERIKPELFFKLSLLAEGARGQQLIVNNQELFVFDPLSLRVFSFEYPNKRSRTFSGGEIIKGKKFLGVAGSNRFYLLDDLGIVFWDGKDRQERVIEKEWNDPGHFLFWASNFYVFDQPERQLLKFVGLGQGYGPPSNWFVDSSSLDWEKIKDLAIDGNVWFLLENGEVKKFYKGRPDSFVLEKNPRKQSLFLGLATEGERLAILTVENELLVWDKKGDWRGQVNLDLGSVIDLALSPGGEWLFLLTDGEVYSLNLNEALP